MLRNYLMLTVRTVRRRAGYVGLNVTGLALGLSVCLLIGLFVRDELSYDQFHENADRIFRVNAYVASGSMELTIGLPDPAGPYLVETRPEVEYSVRVEPALAQTIHHQGERFKEHGFLHVDPNFFDVFSFEVLRGDAFEALRRSNTILITPDLAQRYFGDDDPIGQTLHLEDGTTEVEVAALIAAPPPNSLLQFQAVLPYPVPPGEAWDLNRNTTYLLLRHSDDADIVKAILPDLLVAAFDGRIQSATAHVEPFTRLYLHSNGMTGFAQESARPLRGKVKYVYAFSLIALLILVVACINYVNLATARAAERAQEVGIRKALGAGRGELVGQFLFEAAVLTAISLLIAAVIVSLLLPHLNALTDKTLGVDYLIDPIVLILVVGVGVIVTLLAGLYPAVYLASFRPVTVLRRTPSGSPDRPWMRRGLVVFQFAISGALALCALVIHRQLDYLHQKDLGFESEWVIQLSSITKDRYPAYKQALLSVDGVRSVSIGPELPGYQGGFIAFSEDSPMKPESSLLLPTIATDFDLVETLNFEIIAGRFFDSGRLSDEDQALVLNEAGARAFGWNPEEAIGQIIDIGSGQDYRVLGVAADFHWLSLRHEIEPVAFVLMSDHTVNSGSVLARIVPDRLEEMLDALRSHHSAFFDDTVFTYTFLDDAFAAWFDAEQRLRTLFTAFSFLALVIAALGVLGLVAHASQRRTKEIGIRKVLGATEWSIIGLLSRETLILVGMGFAVAAPVVYIGLQQWLQEFAYRINPGIGLFVSVGLGLLIVALTIAGALALRASRINPAYALRLE